MLDFDLGVSTGEPIALAARARRIPFLFLSGYGEHDERLGRRPGIAILAKPTSAVTIARRILDVLANRS